MPNTLLSGTHETHLQEHVAILSRARRESPAEIADQHDALLDAVDVALTQDRLGVIQAAAACLLVAVASLERHPACKAAWSAETGARNGCEP